MLSYPQFSWYAWLQAEIVPNVYKLGCLHAFLALLWFSVGELEDFQKAKRIGSVGLIGSKGQGLSPEEMAKGPTRRGAQ